MMLPPTGDPSDEKMGRGYKDLVTNEVPGPPALCPPYPLAPVWDLAPYTCPGPPQELPLYMQPTHNAWNRSPGPWLGHHKPDGVLAIKVPCTPRHAGSLSQAAGQPDLLFYCQSGRDACMPLTSESHHQIQQCKSNPNPNYSNPELTQN